MRNHVIFRCSEPFRCVSDEDEVLSVKGVDWFATLLRQIPSLEVDPEFCQEDWGVVIFVRRNRKKFWIGLTQWPDGEEMWLAHVHHDSFAWLQRLTPDGKEALQRLIHDFDLQLSTGPQISAVTWYRETDLKSAALVGNEKPEEN